MVGIKRRLELIETLNTSPFSFEKIPEYLTHVNESGMAKPILKCIIYNLVLLDTEISASYDLISEEEWDSLFGEYDTPLPENLAEIKKNVDLLITNFFKIFEIISELPIKETIELLKSIFVNKTKNIQFLLFNLCDKYSREIFSLLFSGMKKDIKKFLPFYVSLIVRYKMENKEKYFQAYSEFVKCQKLDSSINSVLAFQGLLYIICFNQNLFEIHKELITKINDIGLFRYMNKEIVDKFCGIFNFKSPKFTSYKNDCFYRFPFDLPIIGSLRENIEQKYVNFGD